MERICPACGERVIDDRARFCPICATALPEIPAEDVTNALEEALRDCYRDYRAWAVLTRSKEGGGKRFLELLLGSSDFKNSEKHEEFFNAAKEKAEALLAAYRAAPGSGDVAALLRYVLIDCHNAAGDADWMLLVAEQLFVDYPLLLSPADAAALYEDYGALRKKQTGFDFQRKLLKGLKKQGDRG